MGQYDNDGDEFWGTYGGSQAMFDEMNNPIVGRHSNRQQNNEETMNQQTEQPKPKRPHPTISVVKAENSQLSFIKGLIIGDSGAGKSYLVATAPKPLVLLTEPNGAMSIQASNPDALIIHINDLKHMREVLSAIRDNKINADFSPIVIDSLTDLQRWVANEILLEPDKRNQNKSTETLSMNDWGKLLKRFTELICKIRDLPYHLICTALVDVTVEEETGTRHIHPMFAGKAKMTISQYFNGVGFLYRTGQFHDCGSAERALLLDGIERVKCKPFPNTVGTMKAPNLSHLFTTILESNK